MLWWVIWDSHSRKWSGSRQFLTGTVKTKIGWLSLSLFTKSQFDVQFLLRKQSQLPWSSTYWTILQMTVCCVFEVACPKHTWVPHTYSYPFCCFFGTMFNVEHHKHRYWKLVVGGCAPFLIIAVGIVSCYYYGSSPLNHFICTGYVVWSIVPGVYLVYW